jgi:hypothetical protein
MTQPRLDVARVEQLVRDVITAYRLPIELARARHEPPHWRVLLRDASQRLFNVEIADTVSGMKFLEHLKDRLIR